MAPWRNLATATALRAVARKGVGVQVPLELLKENISKFKGELK